jgi:phage terminase large subunit-like protein
MARRKTPPPATSAADDPVTHYARAVLHGDIIAGPHVRAACSRHLRDLDQGPARGLVWDVPAALRAVGFFRDVLRLNGGQFEGLAFELLPWQAFIVGSLHGWKSRDGFRRFRQAYIETAKGSGKSPLVAGLGLYGLMADGEARAEVYAAATKRDQAMILFRDAVAMCRQSPALSARVSFSGNKGNEWNIAAHSSASFFRPIASDDSQSGPRPHIALLDEIHEHKDGVVVEMMRAGTKSRRQALILEITNSGAGRTGVCWDHHEYSRKVAAGQVEDDAWFAFVCSLDEADDPFRDESCWLKANPSLQHADLPGIKYIREQVVQARGMPAKESVVRRLNFCQWTDSASPWIAAEPWLGAQAPYTLADLRGRSCFAGLDLGSTQDLTACVLAFPPQDDGEPWRLWPLFWLPADTLLEKSDRDRQPYELWARQGHLLTTQGGRAVNRNAVAQQLAAALSDYQIDLVAVAYDRWRIEDFRQVLADLDLSLPLVEFGQGYKDMSPAIDELERLLLNGQLQHPGNPVLTWNAANAVLVQDPAGNRKLAKDKATGRIDGIVAAAMAIGAAQKHVDRQGSINDFLQAPVIG